MNRQYKHNGRPYHNNHCTQSAIEFTPHLVDSQCINDTLDYGQSEYDTLEDWVSDRIDYVMNEDIISWGESL